MVEKSQTRAIADTLLFLNRCADGLMSNVYKLCHVFGGMLYEGYDAVRQLFQLLCGDAHSRSLSAGNKTVAQLIAEVEVRCNSEAPSPAL